MDIQIGTKASYKVTVDTSNTAKSMGSGSLDVFATPSMVAIMEKASTMALESYLEDGCQPVDGTVYGQSITDPCLGWEKTEKLICELADMVD